MRNYKVGRDWRNWIAHTGRRVFYETAPVVIQQELEPQRQAFLTASMSFALKCWVVFSRLWNTYIHAVMLNRAANKGRAQPGG